MEIENLGELSHKNNFKITYETGNCYSSENERHKVTWKAFN